MRPRIRTLKPEIWADERVGQLSHGARLLFIGLITMADDDGRLRELPTAILGHIFPYDQVTPSKLTRWLNELAATGIIIRYVADTGRYLAFRHWTRHQKVDRPTVSELPPPPDDSPNGRRTFDEKSTNGRRGLDDDSRSARARARRSDPDPGPDPGPDPSSKNAEQDLFDYWRDKCRHEHSKPTRERIAKIKARLSEGYTPAQIRQAIDGAARAAFVNDAGKRFDDVELICRSGSKLESFIDRSHSTVNVAAVGELDRKRLTSMRRLKGGAA